MVEILRPSNSHFYKAYGIPYFGQALEVRLNRCRKEYSVGSNDSIDVTELLGSNNHYGTFRVLANLSVTIEGITEFKSYNRSLDLNTGIHTTTFMASDLSTYTTATYCSHPAKACIYRISSTGKLPNIAVAVENRLVSSKLYKTSCGPSQIRLTGTTQDGNPKGMEYDLLVRLSTGPLGMPMSSCSSNRNGTIVVTGSAYGKDMPLNSLGVIIGAATNYDMAKGNAKDKYSFRGLTPGTSLEKATAQISTKLESKLMVAHVQDYQKLMNEFQIQLYDPWKSSQYPSESLQFSQLLDRYRYTAGISSSNSRVAVNEQAAKKKAGIGADFKNDRIAQFKPVPPAQIQSTWSPVATHESDSGFPKFPFPTNLAAGATPKGPIAWSSSGTVTVTGHDGVKHTVTLSVTETDAPTAVSVAPVDNVVKKRAEEEAVFSNESSFEADDPSTAQGDPYVEALLFDYARHLFISSSREDSLPPNLQGVWEDKLECAWSGDYHANINLQMNHWFADQVGLGPLQAALWNYMEKTWVRRLVT
jgi:Glycosyl hydrolase family 65, N-terminal domain